MIMAIMNEAFCDLGFHQQVVTHTTHEAYMTISIRVKCTAFVPREAIPRGISYLGTKGGSDDRISLSSAEGALATLRQRDQRPANVEHCGPTYFLFQYVFITAAVAENHLSTMANMNTPTHVPKTARSV